MCSKLLTLGAMHFAECEVGAAESKILSRAIHKQAPLSGREDDVERGLAASLRL